AGGLRRRDPQHPGGARPLGTCRTRASAALQLGGDGTEDGRGLPGGAVTVSAVVISHGHARELERSLPALAPQVDELVVVANVPGSVGALPEGVRVLENERPLSFAANANQGFKATTGEAVVVANPDAVPEPGAVVILRDFM